jgi:5-formyltetrahydrofolate cyclo-ligase
MPAPRPNRTVTVEKRKLRQAMLAKRAQIPHAATNTASNALARQFADHPILAFAPSFAGYRAMRGEMDVTPIFHEMARFQKQSALPIMMPDKSLRFRSWRPGDALARHALGVEEPLESAHEITPAIILVPLLAFDGDGYRLGYGGGYYDRTMAHFRALPNPPLFIGVGYSLQEIEQVPNEPHDAPLDGILTELGVSMFSY